jgi:hypothetical protein
MLVSTLVVVAAAGIALGACGEAAPETRTIMVPLPQPPPLPKPKPPPPCIAVPDDDAGIQHATVIGSRVGYCVGDGSDRCFALDIGNGELEHVAGPSPDIDEAAKTTAHVETANPELKVCTPAACKTLTSKILPGTAPLHAATNPAGTYAAVLLGDDEAGKGTAEVWDVAAGKRLAVIRYARGRFRCGDIAFVGDTVLVTARTCAEPSARGALYTIKGRKLANVGGADFGLFGGAYVHLTGANWAFLEENGQRIAVQDVVKGKVLKTIDTSAIWQRPDAQGSDAIGNPGESALLSLAPGKVALVAGSPANGSVATVDIETGAVAITRAPLCIQ